MSGIHNGFVQYPDFARTDTLLKIGGVVFGKWTGHGLEQSIEEEVAGTLTRAADAGLLFLGAFPAGDDRNLRFSTRMSGSDIALPPLGFIRAGVAYPVECVAELEACDPTSLTAEGLPGRVAPAAFERKHVPGSIVLRKADWGALASDGEGNLANPADEALIARTTYRPVLLCKLVSKSQSLKPWGDSSRSTWSLEMREHQPLAKG